MGDSLPDQNLSPYQSTSYLPAHLSTHTHATSRTRTRTHAHRHVTHARTHTDAHRAPRYHQIRTAHASPHRSHCWIAAISVAAASAPQARAKSRSPSRRYSEMQLALQRLGRSDDVTNSRFFYNVVCHTFGIHHLPSLRAVIFLQSSPVNRAAYASCYSSYSDTMPTDHQFAGAAAHFCCYPCAVMDFRKP